MGDDNATITRLELEEMNAQLSYGLNTMWLLITGIGIVLMQAGFMALEVGVTRAKNVKATLFKNTVDHAVGAMSWYCVGFSLFIGSNPFAAGDDVTWFNHFETEYARIFQQYGFAVTSSTIVSGAVLSRCRLRVYVCFSMFLSLYIYPIVAHWAWVPGGWLYQLGFLDFAGSGVVHLLGGICAFVGAMACGPRVGRFSDLGDSFHSEQSKSFNDAHPISEETPLRHRVVNALCCGSPRIKYLTDVLTLNHNANFQVRAQPGHSAPMQCMGALLLYVAWFSFNAGSSGGVDTIPKADSAARAAINTMLAAASGTVTALIWSDIIRKQYDIDLVVNGLLSGMVSVTAGCGYIDPWAAIVVGILAVPCYIWTSNFVLYGLHIDDPIDATAVHCANGFLGVLWTGLADINNGLFHTGSIRLFGVQALGGLCIFAWGFANAWVYFYFLKWGVPYLLCHDTNEDDSVKENSIVHSQDAQLVGLDFLYFGGSGFPEFDVEAVSEYNATQRVKERFRAKRLKTMRLFEREAPESSTHGGSKHLSNRFDFHSPTNATGANLPFSNSALSSSASTPRHSTLQGKRPSEQTIVVDSQLFSMENPANEGDDDVDAYDPEKD